MNDREIVPGTHSTAAIVGGPSLKTYAQPLLAFAALAFACCFAIIPTHKVCMVGRALGEHWYSIYNCMLAATAALFFLIARKLNRPDLSWGVWDITLCCAILSLGFKLVPLRRPDGAMHGFPSGHSLTAFAVSSLLLHKFPKLSPYAFAIAVAVGWSRVEIREHFVYQVLIGAVMGVIVGAAVSHAKENVGVLLPRIIRRQVAAE